MGNPIREDPRIARVIRVPFVIGSGLAGLGSWATFYDKTLSQDFSGDSSPYEYP